MRTANFDHAQTVLAKRGSRSKENRTAFITALLMDRCRVQPDAPDTAPHPMPPAYAVAFALEFVRLAALIHAEAVAACNGERSAAQEAADARNKARFKELAEALGFEARTGGDPRGACAYLIDPDDRRGGDGWAEGWAVYR